MNVYVVQTFSKLCWVNCGIWTSWLQTNCCCNGTHGRSCNGWRCNGFFNGQFFIYFYCGKNKSSTVISFLKSAPGPRIQCGHSSGRMYSFLWGVPGECLAFPGIRMPGMHSYKECFHYEFREFGVFPTVQFPTPPHSIHKRTSQGTSRINARMLAGALHSHLTLLPPPPPPPGSHLCWFT